MFRKLDLFIDMDAQERALLRSLLEQSREVPTGTALVKEGEGNEWSYVLITGWAHRHRTLTDGRRQLLNVVLPGDIAALDAHVISPAPASVTTLTACRVAVFAPSQTLQLIAHGPRLAASLLWMTAREEAFLGERLVSLGRRPAIDRVAHLFVELYHRLRLVGLAGNDEFVAPLTLEHVADALGLSVVHASRTFSRLRDMNLLVRRNAQIRILDLPALEARVEFPGLYLRRGLSPGERYLRGPFGPASPTSTPQASEDF
ncbi:MAG: Crp/Fnr family transcriptional regulator [Rhodospirillaceae bacterium]|nr:Crp/Fnr family transcriptional regulator [Rhodospirillaceae bacterium]